MEVDAYHRKSTNAADERSVRHDWSVQFAAYMGAASGGCNRRNETGSRRRLDFGRQRLVKDEFWTVLLGQLHFALAVWCRGPALVTATKVPDKRA